MTQTDDALKALEKLHDVACDVTALEWFEEFAGNKNSITSSALTDYAKVEGEQDYFGELVSQSRVSAEKAMIKFPQPNYVTLKIAEESGEVVRGCVHYAEGRLDWSEVESEIIQLMAMLYRLVNEGDEINGIKPPTLATKTKEVKND